MSDLLSVSEAARILDVAASTIRNYEREGKLPARKTEGGVRLFERETIETFAAGRGKRSRRA